MVATPNGERSLAQIQSELQAAGYNGPWTNADMIAAYLRTTGGGVGPQNAAPQVFGATPPVAGQGSDLSALSAAFNAAGGLQQQQIDISRQGLGLTQQQIANQKAEFDAQLAFQKQQMEQLGLPQLVIQQRLADLQNQQFQYQIYLTQQQQGLAERGLGLQTLQAQAQLGGPSDWVQAYNLAQGLKQTDLPVFEQRLLSGQQAPAAVGGAGLGVPQSLSTLAQQAGAGTPSVTMNGQPVSGGPTSIGGQISPTLAPLPFLSSGAGGVAGAAAAAGGGVGTAGVAPSGVDLDPHLQSVVPGSSNVPGAQHPGGVFGTESANFSTPVYQEFGGFPGRPAAQADVGERGVKLLSYDPQTNGLSLAFKALQPKSGYIAIQDITGQENSPKPLGVQSIAGADLASQQNGIFHLTAPIAQGHTYQAIPVYEGEGGSSTADSIRFTANDVLGLPKAPQQAGAGAAGMPGTAAPGMPGYKIYNGRLWSTNQNGELVSDAGPAPAATAAAGQAGPGGTRIYNGRLYTTNQNGELVNDIGPAAGGTQAQPGAPAAPATPTGPDMSGVYGLGRAIFAAGGGALGPQALETTGPTGTQMLQSVGKAVGADWQTFLSDYLKSRIGQGAAQAG